MQSTETETWQKVRKILQEVGKAKIELRNLGVIRTEKFESDVMEWFTAKQLGLKLAESSVNKGFDATDDDGNTYQIKSRGNSDFDSTSFDSKSMEGFDFLLCVFYNPIDYEITRIYKANRSTVNRLTNVNKKNVRFRWTKETKNDPGVSLEYSNLSK